MSELYDAEWEKLKSALAKQEKFIKRHMHPIFGATPTKTKILPFGKDIIVREAIEEIIGLYR
jgi:hypothetical protein